MNYLDVTEVGERDRAILMLVRELRLVTGGQIRRHAFGEAKVDSTDGRVARRVLQRLTQRGLLVRATRVLGGVRAGSSAYVYALGRRGAQVLGLEPRRHNLDPSLTFLRHTIAISEVFIQLHEAQRSGRFEAVAVEVEPRSWRQLGDGTGVALKPDLFVHATTDTEEIYAYLEVDLATEHQAAVRRKLALYRAHLATGRDQQQLGLFPMVMWLVPDPIRADAMHRYLRTVQCQAPGLHQVVLASEFINQLEKGGDHA